jgi:hypothetical protein
MPRKIVNNLCFAFSCGGTGNWKNNWLRQKLKKGKPNLDRRPHLSKYQGKLTGVTVSRKTDQRTFSCVL